MKQWGHDGDTALKEAFQLCMITPFVDPTTPLQLLYCVWVLHGCRGTPLTTHGHIVRSPVYSFYDA
ncbi:hypothetical protein [Paramuribaculum intestinale]|uniref:hypothetical protein n=1 Tax=Paramuribaculum intestinale TaxID=2094151 RepID=UPI0025A98D36|nr:hypothetical protein [Paramuribaculum intestinale]